MKMMNEPEEKWMKRTYWVWRAMLVAAILGLVALACSCHLRGPTGPETQWKYEPLPPAEPTCPQCGKPVWDNHEHRCEEFR